MLIRIILAVAIIALLVWGLFTTAGRWDWMQGWVYLAVIIGGVRSAMSFFGGRTRSCYVDEVALVKEQRPGTRSFSVFGVTSVLMMFIGALDSGRYQWSVMSPWLWPVGAALYIIGQIVLTWSMLANAFFEKTARIQTNRGHRVIDSGPYRYVRHPGYIGTILGLVLGSPLMLGSWWAFVPAIATVLGLIIRTVLEDRMLMQELAGYEAYAKRVRYRLIPSLW